MKTFEEDRPILRYSLMIVTIIISSFVGTISAALLFGVLFK